jgi:hypothetical protein
MDVKVHFEDGFSIVLKKRGWVLCHRPDGGKMYEVFPIPSMKDGSVPSEAQARQDAARYLRWIADVADGSPRTMSVVLGNGEDN